MSSSLDLKEESLWDDTELIESWNEALNEYKVSLKVLRILNSPNSQCNYSATTAFTVAEEM